MYYKKNCFQIFRNLHRKHLCGSLFLETFNFIKKRPQHRCFPVNISKFLRLSILKKIFEWLIFYCFNGSLLHGPKGSRSRLYEDVRLQGLGHRSSFLILSRHFSSLTDVRPALRRIHLMGQLSVYTEYFWSF